MFLYQGHVLTQMIYILTAIDIWLKKRMRNDTVVDWLQSNQTDIITSSQTDSMSSSDDTHQMHLQFDSPSVLNDRSPSDTTNKSNLSDEKCSVDTLREINDIGATFSICKSTQHIGSFVSGLMDKKKIDPEKNISVIELIRTEQNIASEELRKTIEEMKSSIKDIKEKMEKSSDVSTSELRKRPKGRNHQIKK